MTQVQSFAQEAMKPMEVQKLLSNCFELLVEILKFVKLKSVYRRLIFIEFVMVQLGLKLQAELFDSNWMFNGSSFGELLAFDSEQVGFIFVNMYTDLDVFYY